MTTGETVTLSGPRLIDTVRTAHLSDREVQTLIEILLNRQGVTSATQESWNKVRVEGVVWVM